MAKRVSVETAAFFRSHMKQPKGFGAWMFALGDDPDNMDNWVSFTGTFTEARQQAKATAQSRGFTVVHVLP